MTPTPQEKMQNPNVAPQQVQGKKMAKMALKKAKLPNIPEVQKAKNDLRRLLQQTGVDPQRVIQAGKYAEAALEDKNLYPVAIQKAIAENLIYPNQVQPGVIDYRILAIGITAGLLTQQLVKEGAL